MYYRTDGAQPLAPRLSFTEFCERHVHASDTCAHPTRHRNQYDGFCDAAGNNVMDYIYRVEDFATAVVEIAERTEGRIPLAAVRYKHNHPSPADTYRQLYTDRTRRLIAQHYELDIDHFKYTF